MLTRPRGSRKVTFASLETALNDRNASAKVSALIFPKFAGAEVREPFLVARVAAVVGLNSPVHSFGVVQAFGGVATLGSSGSGSSKVAFLSPSCSSGIALCIFRLSCVFSGTDLKASFVTDFGIAGMTGTAGNVDRCDGFGATGVASLGTGWDGCC